MSDPESGAVEVSLGRRVSVALEFVVKLVAIGVPILYALGRIYSDSYWHELGLTSSLMGDSAEDYLYIGFSSIVVAGARLLGVDVYSTLAYAALVALVVASLTVIAEIVDRWLSKLINKRVTALRERVLEWKASRHGALVRHGLPRLDRAIDIA